MDVVLIGPSDRSVLWCHGWLPEGAYGDFVQKYARILVQHLAPSS